MHLLTLGLNHHTAPLTLREKLAFSPEELVSANEAIRALLGGADNGGIKETAILSTCNRTEIYCAAENSSLAAGSLQAYLAQKKNVSLSELEDHSYVLENEKAVRHAFRVASGLDSMVLGETQIVGQLKKAVQSAESCGGLGLFLNQLFQRTYAVAKEVRSSTEIGAHSISLAAAAVRVANRIFGDLSDSSVLFIGAGEMIELCAAHFCAQKPKKCTVANRTIARAEALASSIHADAVCLSDLPEILYQYDIVISCTASSLPIVGLGLVQSSIKKRRFKPMFMVDLAVPRDIESQVGDLEQVFVYTVDDLGKVVQTGIQNRKAAISSAEVLIDKNIEEFRFWLSARATVPVITSLQKRADDLRKAELCKAKKALSKGEDPEKVLEALSVSLTKKFTHDPVSLLRNSQHLASADHEKAVSLIRGFYEGRSR